MKTRQLPCFDASVECLFNIYEDDNDRSIYGGVAATILINRTYVVASLNDQELQDFRAWLEDNA